MKIGPGVSELWRVENRPLPLTWPMAYTTACTAVQAVIQPMFDYIGFTRTVGVVWVSRRFEYSHFCHRFGVAV